VGESFRLGRIAGVRVGVNISVVVILLIIAGGLAFGRFPLLQPGRSTWVYVLAGVVAALAFLASLLAHEVAHAVVARRNGVEVEGITLWLLGGVAQLKGRAPSPGADFRIAGVGPLTSLVLSVTFTALAVVARTAGLDGLPLAVLDYLAVVNLLLAVFNLLPAAPLDGGRLLRALLWKRRGDAESASITAAKAGRLFGFALIGLGVLQVVTGAGLGGLWLALIGLFLSNAAMAEEQQARLSQRLRGVRIADVMGAPAYAADPDQTVERFLHEVVLVRRFSTYPLVDGSGELVGLVTLNRLRDVPPGDRAVTRLRDIACPREDVPVVAPDEQLVEVLPRLAGCSDGRAVVLMGGRVVGVLSPSDVSRTLQLHDLGALDPYPGSGRGAAAVRDPTTRS
jgi:Zn-dependent protease/CBS domain-containing protein